jgi:protein-tyrosine phosphatase
MAAMSEPYRVMTVCTGNICRSPMAEVVLRDRFEAAGLGGRVVVDSSGVSDEERGHPIDPRARAVLVHRGYDVDDLHRARRVGRDDVAQRDLVLAMTVQHARALRRLADGGSVADDHGLAERVRMYRSFDPDAPRLAPGDPETALDIADPWYGGPRNFEVSLDEIEAAADAIVAHVRAEIEARSA